MSGSTHPLKGIKVVEFSHMVLGPSCGLIPVSYTHLTLPTTHGG